MAFELRRVMDAEGRHDEILMMIWKEPLRMARCGQRDAVETAHDRHDGGRVHELRRHRFLFSLACAGGRVPLA